MQNNQGIHYIKEQKWKYVQTEATALSEEVSQKLKDFLFVKEQELLEKEREQIEIYRKAIEDNKNNVDYLQRALGVIDRTQWMDKQAAESLREYLKDMTMMDSEKDLQSRALTLLRRIVINVNIFFGRIYLQRYLFRQIFIGNGVAIFYN